MIQVMFRYVSRPAHALYHLSKSSLVEWFNDNTFRLSASLAFYIYGAAGSFVIFLIWVYYSALICFFGAEFTQVYTERYGSQLEPAAHAEVIEDPT